MTDPIDDARDRPLADTTAGRVRGITGDDGIRRFLGIPYAKPPFGARRFGVPEPVDPWDGEREATEFGPTAPQNPYRGHLATFIDVPIVSGEDILTVNVWTPADAQDAPVVLWLHGGGLERGAASQEGYDGSTFARDGIVFVSANYRLGAEGFSVLDDAPRNLGLRDAAAALAWVEREITAFGGDPSRITLMGESAGGALVAALAARADTRRMITGAIIQSAPLEAAPVKKARRASDAIARALSVDTTRAGFSSIAPRELLRTRAQIVGESTLLDGPAGFTLVLDEETLPGSPVELLRDAGVPLLIGTNTEEYRLWLSPEAVAGISRAKSAIIRRVLGVSGRATRAIRAAFPGASPGEVLGQAVTDLMLRGPATRVAASRACATYVYEFAWPSPVGGLGAAHAVEIAFAFGRLDSDDALRLNGPDAPATLALKMHEAWVSFIRNGDPGWPPYAHDRTTQVWDLPDTVGPQRRTGIVDALM
ncbi:carboxylesterase family protein [Microbacterium aquimaris]|uniref:carboxylesterase/lipase family protein n=1 Tax=Microbacterium aquimaris TaxID=459816 RepID=UPI002AD22F1A|nr:carboxylesterase family protein [Microbacterium aquimaris]MDZ8275656.1 carboxylesterase family protein [Microbacterium aquimaris]